MVQFRNLRNLQSSFTTDLYHHENCLIKLALEKLNRRQQLLDREANSKVICIANCCLAIPRRGLEHKKNHHVIILIYRTWTWLYSSASSDYSRLLFLFLLPWFSHDVTKTQTKKLSILPRFYFHGALDQLETNFHANFSFKNVLGFVIECAWISKLLSDVAFTCMTAKRAVM